MQEELEPGTMKSMVRAGMMPEGRQLRLVRGHGEDARLDSFLLAADPLLFAAPPSPSLERCASAELPATVSDLTEDHSPDSTVA
jgi:hypothetical protein